VDTIGEKLRSTREARRLSLKDVAKDTNISVTYIEALENEEFDRFPGETYVTGFMRSYADYLKLDADEIIQHYKAFKIGESATPLEELTRPTRTPVFINLVALYSQYRSVALFAGGALGLVLIIWMFVSLFSSSIDVGGGDSISNIQDEYNRSKQNIGIENIRNLQLANDSGFTLLYGSEAVQFMVDNKEVLLLLKEIKKDSVVVELLPGERGETLEMDKPVAVKLPEFVREVVFTLKGLTENRAKIQIVLGQKPEAETKDVAVEKGVDKNADNTRVVAQNEKNLKIVFEAEFIQKSYLELYLDGAEKRRGFMAAGTHERWEATEFIQVKIGNAGGLKARINGKDYNFGQPGQVANKVITWKKDINNPNVYQIMIKDW
jgi:transcriptional regulator with XRE-family HTH domain